MHAQYVIAADCKPNTLSSESYSTLSLHAKTAVGSCLQVLTSTPRLCLDWDETICVFYVFFFFLTHKLLETPSIVCYLIAKMETPEASAHVDQICPDDRMCVCVWMSYFACTELFFVIFWFATLYGFTISKGGTKHIKKQYKSKCVVAFFVLSFSVTAIRRPPSLQPWRLLCNLWVARKKQLLFLAYTYPYHKFCNKFYLSFMTRRVDSSNKIILKICESSSYSLTRIIRN